MMLSTTCLASAKPQAWLGGRGRVGFIGSSVGGGTLLDGGQREEALSANHFGCWGFPARGD